MAYTPVATDPTQPAGTVDASTAADEFRTLKAYVAGLAFGAAGFKAPVRQTVVAALIASITGLPAFLSIGAGLGVNVSATASPIRLTAASGWDVNGPIDLNSQITVDTAAAWTVPINNTSYLSYDILTASTGTYGQTLALPRYENAYPQNNQALLHLDGANNAVVTTDDYGNTWTMVGGAKLTTSYAKIGTTSLGGAGATNALNGAADYLKSTNFTSLGGGSWAMRCWTKPLNALPGAAAVFTIASIGNTAGFGAELDIFNNAGTIKFAISLSSTGAAFDVASAVQGTTTPVLGTEYYIEFTFDALAGVYRLYVNGTQEATVVSALRTCAVVEATLGVRASTHTNFYQGYIDEFELVPYCDHPNGTAYVAPTVAKSVATAGYSADWFSLNEMKMYQVTAPSTVAGTPPTLTSKLRVYMGEADSSGAAVTAIRTYALNGRFDNLQNPTVFAVNTAYLVNHNIGVPSGQIQISTLVKSNTITADWFEPSLANSAGVFSNGSSGINRNTAGVNTGTTGMQANTSTTNAALSVGNAATGFIAIKARRSWGGS